MSDSKFFHLKVFFSVIILKYFFRQPVPRVNAAISFLCVSSLKRLKNNRIMARIHNYTIGKGDSKHLHKKQLNN